MKNVYLLYLVVLCWILYETESKYAVGTIDTTLSKQDWVFITRFCFLSNKGTLQYNFIYPVIYATEKILLYYDEPGQWNAVYKKQTNCSTKVSVLNPAQNQIISLDQGNDISSFYSGCKILKKQDGDYFNCSGTRTFRSARERWWFIALARCTTAPDQPSGLKLDYTIHMTNADDDDILRHEFSADEFYILPVDIAFLLAYLFIFALSILCAVLLKGRQLFHTTYKMYLCAIGLWTFHLLLLSIGYGRYAETGFPEPKTILAARVFRAASELIFLLMLILMGKGYTITRGKLSSSGTIKITVFTCVYVVVYVVLFIWEAELFDPGEVLYLYDSPPGYGLVVLRLIGWVWFLYAIFFTVKHFPNKALFFYPFFIFYTLWFWAGPIVILIAQHAMSLWVREKTVNGVEQFVALLGHVFFLILTRPNAANKNFPYHVRTTQIGTMEGLSAEPSPHNQTTYPDMPYSVTANNLSYQGTGPDLSSMFVVSNTHSEPTKDLKRPVFNPNFEPDENPPRAPEGPLPPLRLQPSAPPPYELFSVSKNKGAFVEG